MLYTEATATLLLFSFFFSIFSIFFPLPFSLFPFSSALSPRLSLGSRSLWGIYRLGSYNNYLSRIRGCRSKRAHPPNEEKDLLAPSPFPVLQLGIVDSFPRAPLAARRPVAEPGAEKSSTKSSNGRISRNVILVYSR